MIKWALKSCDRKVARFYFEINTKHHAKEKIMPRFFTDETINDNFIMTGENARHAIKSLRMKKGESLVICDGNGKDYHGEVDIINSDTLTVKINKVEKNTAESDLIIHLYQCMPKSDKMDYIIQKATELGVFDITPVLSSRCIAGFNGKEEKKLARFNKISLEASKQSGRGIVPKINAPVKYEAALKNAEGTKIFFYEKGGVSLHNIDLSIKEISILIGPEGGFSEDEATKALENGFITASLGNRILRTETASLSAISILQFRGESHE